MLSVRDLGSEGVNFEVERGSFTVVTGKIGSGKSMLVRGLLGLIPAPGEVRWNGELVEDRGIVLRSTPLRLHRPGSTPLFRVVGRQHRAGPQSRPRAACDKRCSWLSSTRI